MEHRILVVDRSYRPIEVQDWTDALPEVIKGRYTVLEYGNVTVNSAYKTWTLPEIVIASTNLRVSKKVKFNEDSLFGRDNYTCAYCGKKFNSSKLSVDHIHPKKLKGTNTWGNCITACKKCNGRKGHKTLNELGVNLKFHPIIPENTLEFSIFTMNLKDEWLDYLPRTISNYARFLKERTIAE